MYRQPEICSCTPEQWYGALSGIPMERTLDLACGEGDFAAELLAEVGSITCLRGIDVDPNHLSEAKRYFLTCCPSHVSFDFFLGNLETLVTGGHGKLKGPWNTVLLGISLHHIRNIDSLLPLIYDLVHPGGRLIITEMVSDGLTPPEIVARDLHHLKAWVDRSIGIDHAPTFTTTRILDLVSTVQNTRNVQASETYLVSDQPSITWDRTALDARKDFIETYLLHCKDDPEYSRMKREFHRVSQELIRCGYREPPRLSIILTKPPNHTGDLSW